MDFARKQLEKYGWKEGEGLGKIGNEGISEPIKAKLKSGKEGMGFDLAKDLVDPWWENAYNESLKRVNVEMQATVDQNKSKSTKKVVVSMNMEDQASDGDPPAAKIMKRMMRSNFTDFSKGATLTNGTMEDEKTEGSDEDKDKDNEITKKSLTDEELLKACGGRTCHKAARFGYRLSGKLARLAAQDELELRKLKVNQEKIGSS